MRVVTRDELQHLDEMLVVIKCRKRPRLPTLNPVGLVERHCSNVADERSTIAAAVFLKRNEWIGKVAYQ